MQMPIMDGYLATRQLRDNQVRIPIVALTANAMQEDEAKCRQAGCDGFLTKPIDLDRLQQLLLERLGAATVTSSNEPSTEPPRAAAPTTTLGTTTQ